MAAFFHRIQRKKTTKPDETFIWVAHSGEVTQPRTGQQMKPWLPLAGSVENDQVDDRRELFAAWLTTPENPFFAKIEANRIWSQLLGRGIVDPPDDFRDSNPPSNAALLEALAEDFIRSGFDRKHLIRTILNSRTYQASSQTGEFNNDDEKYFSHYQPRLLSAEQLLDAVCHVTELAETFGSLPPGTKATQLPAPDLVKVEFLKTFGQPERQTVCLCERPTDSNLGMAIEFFNGELIYNKIRNGNNRFRKLLAGGKSDEEIITDLYLAAVCRPPTKIELAAGVNFIAEKKDQLGPRNTETETQIAEQSKQISATRTAVYLKLLAEKLQAVPEALRADLQSALLTEEGKRNEVQRYLTEKLGPLVAVSDKNVADAVDDAGKKAIAGAEAKIAELKKGMHTADTLRIEALEDICWAILNTNEFLFQH
jgi:hypothetical protein